MRKKMILGKPKKRFLHHLSLCKLIRYGILFVLAAIIWIPIYMMASGTLIGPVEINEYLNGGVNGGYVKWPIFPIYPTLRSYVGLLLDTPNFFVMFGNSVKQVVPAIAGQLLIGVPAAWSFSRFRFPGKRFLFGIYIVLMILPFQVTMVSNYLIIQKLKLLDTHLSIILPAVFSTFPVFIMVKFFTAIPNDMIEAAKIDGAGSLAIFTHIGVPIGYSGIMSAVILSFIELWNALEQPLTFIRDKSLWPLPLFLPQIATQQVGVSFIASILMMLPALLIFLMGEGYLEQGIVASGIKQ